MFGFFGFVDCVGGTVTNVLGGSGRDDLLAEAKSNSRQRMKMRLKDVDRLMLRRKQNPFLKTKIPTDKELSAPFWISNGPAAVPLEHAA
jgi:hypothetical protein